MEGKGRMTDEGRGRAIGVNENLKRGVGSSYLSALFKLIIYFVI
jgi:hypothetical protein